MAVIQYISDFIITNGLIIALFVRINRIKPSIVTFLKAYSLKVPIALIIATLNNLFSSNFFSILNEPLYGLCLAILFLNPLPKTLILFYGLFPVTLWNLFYRSFSYFILPIFGLTAGYIENDLVYTLILFCAVCLVLLFINWLGYDFVKLRTDIIDQKDKRILHKSNWAMVGYYVAMELLTYLEYEVEINTMSYRQLTLVVNLIVFMGVIKQLDTHIKEKLQEKLAFQQTLQLQEMETYSNHIEGLYREVRGFRHDYANLLTTLRLGIEDNDMSQVREIYGSVLMDSNKRLRDKKYDIGRLMNIENSALKSLLAAKFMQASENNITVTLEAPEIIKPQGIEVVDFITVVSILFDNAIEATIDTELPKINVAFLTVNNKQMFIIENTIKDESVDISEIYSFGQSSKGSDRGVGLYNVMTIIERYPNAALNTTSQDYMFCQILEINLK